jgi:Fe2+ or Zn2+ uptake regulation protein
MAQQARVRDTRQRRVVYEAIRGARSHPTADWIFEQVRCALPKISLGTVYRNLAVLKREGLVREVMAMDRRARYEANICPHAHFVCTACGEVRDVMGISEVDWRTQKDLVGCDVTGQRVELFGLCPACQRRRRSRAARPLEA